MAVKVIGACLTLSCIFLCALGELKITKEQLSQFKGTDPTKYCGNEEKLKKFCSVIAGKPEGGHFKKCYPGCQPTEVKVQKKCGKGTEITTIKVVVCAWENENAYYVSGKGQTPNTVMNYLTDSNGVCSFHKEIPYKDE